MTDQANQPLAPTRDSGATTQAERPAPDSDTPTDAGAPQPVDLERGDQSPEGRPDRAPWGQETAADPHTQSDAGAPQAVDLERGDQSPERRPDPAPWGQEAAAGPAAGAATTTPREEPQPDGAENRPSSSAVASPADGAQRQSAPPDLDALRERWGLVQGAFVDDPKAAVEEADRLVSEAIQDLERRLTGHREQMQGEWTDSEPDTEQLRLLLHGYRALFNRLLDSGF